MKTHEERAVELFREGRNCAQAVVGAFCDVTGMDFSTALRLSGTFGGGFGRMREVCGAVSGMCMVLGMLYGYDSADDPAEKKAVYAMVQEQMKAFAAENGSYICAQLLGTAGKDTSPIPEARTEAYYKRRPCVELVACAARLTQTYIDANPLPDVCNGGKTGSAAEKTGI